MPINAASTLLQLSPVRPIDIGSMGGGGSSLELQRLELMKQQFEETRRRNAEDERIRQMSEAGQMRRAELSAQMQQEKINAQRLAKQEERKRALMDQMQKYRDAGDVEGIQALMNSAQEAGMNVDLLGTDEHGMPSYQVDFDADQAAQQEDERMSQAAPYGADETAVQSLDRLGALGYPSVNEAGNLDDVRTAMPNTTEDTFGKALEATQHYDETGEPMRGPDQADLTGGVQKNVLDFGAQQSSVARRLHPALGALQRSYTEPYQDSVGETNAAVEGMGLPATESLKLAKELRQGPDAAIAKQVDQDAEDAKREAEANKPITRKEKQALIEGGAGEAEKMYKNRGIDETFHRSAAAQSILDILANEDPDDDMSIAFELPKMLGSIGAQSNKDLAVALGLESMSTVDQITERISRIIKGGYTEMHKETLMNIVKNKMQQDDDLIFEFLDAADEAANDTEDEAVRHGLQKFVNGNVPANYRKAWQKARDEQGAKEKPAAAGAQYDPTTADDEEENEPPGPEEAEPADPSEVDAELAAQAKAAGLDVARIRPLVSTESGGDTQARNQMGSSARGLFQFTDETARAYGLKDADAYAALPAKKQIELGIRRFKALGLDENSSRDDYAIANAAPAYVGRPDETVIEQYRSGTKRGDKVREQNPGWIPADGGEITVGSIKAFYRGGKKASAEEKKPSEEQKPKKKSRLDADVDSIFGG